MPQLHLSRLHLRSQQLLAAAFCVGVVVLLALSGSAYGQAATSPTTPGEKTPLGPATQAAGEGATSSTATEGGGSGGLVRTIVGLLIVIAVIYGVTWILKQLKSREVGGAIGDGLENRATLPLGPGRSVHLVRAGNEYLLLGVAEGAVQTLRSYTEGEARAAGFPVDEAEDLAPLKDAPGEPTTFVGRIRDLTVRR